MSKDDEIREIHDEEQRRGKRPIDIAARRRRLILRKKFFDAIQLGDEDKFREALIRDLGQLPGSPEFESSMRAWRAYHGKKQSQRERMRPHVRPVLLPAIGRDAVPQSPPTDRQWPSG